VEEREQRKQVSLSTRHSAQPDQTLAADLGTDLYQATHISIPTAPRAAVIDFEVDSAPPARLFLFESVTPQRLPPGVHWVIKRPSSKSNYPTESARATQSRDRTVSPFHRGRFACALPRAHHLSRHRIARRPSNSATIRDVGFAPIPIDRCGAVPTRVVFTRTPAIRRRFVVFFVVVVFFLVGPTRIPECASSKTPTEQQGRRRRRRRVASDPARSAAAKTAALAAPRGTQSETRWSAQGRTLGGSRKSRPETAAAASSTASRWFPFTSQRRATSPSRQYRRRAGPLRSRIPRTNHSRARVCPEARTRPPAPRRPAQTRVETAGGPARAVGRRARARSFVRWE
jgi:hypothetical protein